MPWVQMMHILAVKTVVLVSVQKWEHFLGCHWEICQFFLERPWEVGRTFGQCECAGFEQTGCHVRSGM